VAAELKARGFQIATGYGRMKRVDPHRSHGRSHPCWTGRFAGSSRGDL
jgi:hypothetical protein